MIITDCVLEYDENTGVLYVHSTETGVTVLRVCGLPKRKPHIQPGMLEPQMDVTLKYQLLRPYTFNW